jgi:AcrR family transcriptional regulator
MPPRAAAPNISDTLSRSARKDFTRTSLLQAALTLMGDGRSFTSLGLREIAREAGVVPTAFYRHFRNTDELGLVLVEEVGITLRRLLREARKMDVAPRDMLRRSVSVYQEYVKVEPIAVHVHLQ